MAWRGVAGVAWRGVAWRGVACGVAWRGVAWRGVASRWRGVAWRGVDTDRTPPAGGLQNPERARRRTPGSRTGPAALQSGWAACSCSARAGLKQCQRGRKLKWASLMAREN